MELDLNGRVAIVTGGGKGIGKSIAMSLANAGAKVVICARSKESLSSVQNDINKSGGECLYVCADVCRPEPVQKVIDTTIEKFGGIDILVNNAGGVTKFAGFFELTDSDWLETFQLNVMSVVYFIRYALPFLQQSQAARVINISSISGVEPGSYNPHYTITKAAIINLSKFLSNLVAGKNVLVNVVCPGPVHSHSWDMNVERIAKIRNISFDEAKIQIDSEESAKIPIGWIGGGEDVASLVTFLASEKSRWITGSCFHVNGGKLRSMC